MSYLSEVPLDAAAIRAIGRGLFTIARSDGLHAKELSLIDQFSQGTGPGTLSAISPEQLASELTSPEERLLFMKLGLMLARVQGGVSSQERKVIGGFAQALELTGADLLALELELIKELQNTLAA